MNIKAKIHIAAVRLAEGIPKSQIKNWNDLTEEHQLEAIKQVDLWRKQALTAAKRIIKKGRPNMPDVNVGFAKMDSQVSKVVDYWAAHWLV